MALVDCQMEVCSSRLKHICQGEYVAMHEIYIDGAERTICSNCVDDIWMGGKAEKLKKVGHSTEYSREESEEDVLIHS